MMHGQKNIKLSVLFPF